MMYLFVILLVKVGDLQKVLVDAQKKADARKEELQTKTKQVEKLEVVINDLQNRVRIFSL